MTLDPRDVHVEISFTDLESRFMAYVMEAIAPHITTNAQRRLAGAVCAKFAGAGQAMIDDLIAKHGVAEVTAYAEGIDESDIATFR